MSVQFSIKRKTAPDIRARKPAIEAAVEGYARDVRARAFPGPEHVYGMKEKG